MPMSQTPRVSVVMAARNATPYLQSALNSILGQTFADFELIVIDDASTDETPAILAEYAEHDRRMIVLRNDRRTGQGEAANRGLERAQGEYIARQDADDVSFPERLKQQVEFLDSHPEFDLIGARAYVIDAEGAPVAPARLVTEEQALYAELQEKRNWITNGSTMFRRRLNVRYRGKIFCEEVDLFLRLFGAGHRLTVLPEILYQYRISRTHITATRKIEQALHAEQCMRFHRQRQESGTDDYASWDAAKALDDYRLRAGNDPSLLDAEFNYRRGLMYPMFTNGVYAGALRHAAYLLTHFAPWRMGLRWTAINLFVAVKSLGMIFLGRDQPPDFAWPEKKSR